MGGQRNVCQLTPGGPQTEVALNHGRIMSSKTKFSANLGVEQQSPKHSQYFHQNIEEVNQVLMELCLNPSFSTETVVAGHVSWVEALAKLVPWHLHSYLILDGLLQAQTHKHHGW